MEYRDCNHDWECVMQGEKVAVMRCKCCHLSVELFQDHLSVWDYTVRKSQRFIVSFPYPDKPSRRL